MLQVMGQKHVHLLFQLSTSAIFNVYISSVLLLQKLTLKDLIKLRPVSIMWWPRVRMQMNTSRTPTLVLTLGNLYLKYHWVASMCFSLCFLKFKPSLLLANKTLLTLFASSWDSRVPVSLSNDLIKNQKKTLFVITEIHISQTHQLKTSAVHCFCFFKITDSIK